MLRKTKYTLLIATTVFVAIELILQIRSQIKIGQSVFNVIYSDSTYITDPNTQLMLLNPNHVIKGTEAVIESNSYGLRDSEFPRIKPEKEIRIAIVGASTVMGTYSKSNKSTLAARLQYHYQLLNPSHQIRVINAGIVGFGLSEQAVLISKLISTLGVDLLIIYPGFNDLSQYCHSVDSENKALKNNYSLPKIELPKWLLSVELITKNTVWLRSGASKNNKTSSFALNTPDINNLDTKKYEQGLINLIKTIESLKIPAIFVGNARAFRKNMPIDLQNKLAQTAIFYNPCFNVNSLHILYDKHNDLLEKYAKKAGISFFNMQLLLPGGTEYFGDATHFSELGTDKEAEIIASKLTELGYRFIVHGKNPVLTTFEK